jgi:hypothetical protein
MIKSNVGYVYLINEVDTHNYKIGVSKKPANDERIKNLQTGNHNQLSLIFELKSNCYTTLEKTLHRTFKYNNIRGEWFEFSNQDTIINEIKKINGSLEMLLEQSTFNTSFI